MINIALMHSQKKLKRPIKKSKLKIVDLPDQGPMTSVDFVAQLDILLRDKTKTPIKVMNKEYQLCEEWIKLCLPEWKSIWKARGIEIKWNLRQKCFFLSWIK